MSAHLAHHPQLKSNKLLTVVLFILAGLILGISAIFENTQMAFMSVAVLVLSLTCMQIAIRLFDFHHLTIPAVFYFAFLAMIYLPGLLLYFVQHQQAEPASFLATLQILMERLPSQELPTRSNEVYVYALQVALLSIPAGVIMANLIFHFKLADIKQYWQRPILPESESFRVVIYGALLMVSLGAVIYNLRQIGQIPLLYALMNPGNTIDIVIYREQLKLLPLPFFAPYLFRWTGDLFLPLASMVALERFVTRRSGKWFLLFLLAVLVAVFYNFMTGERKPLAQFIAVLLFFAILLGILKLNWPTVLVGSMAVLILPGLSYIWLYGWGLDWSGILNTAYKLYERLFQVPATTLAWYFQFFPTEAGGFLYGRSNRWIALLTGQEFFNTASYVSQRMFSGGPLGTGLANTAFVGNGYADFGLIGVGLLAFMVGAALQSTQIIIFHHAKTALHLGLYAFLAISSVSLTSLDVFSFALTFGPLVAFVILIGARPLLRQLATKKIRV